jgi:tetratricopeptide (TPR) repeat protein
MRESAAPRICAFIALALVAAVFAVFWVVKDHQFIAFDDNVYIWENGRVSKGLSWSNVHWAFTSLYASNWHPLTWLSHMLDCDLFRRSDGTQWEGGHHLVNVVYHAANTAILFLLLNAITHMTWRSAFVAALFGLHPLHVESVAWLAERKDVLSTFFGLIAIWCYVRFVREWGPSSVVGDVKAFRTPHAACEMAESQPPKVMMWYGLMIGSFVLSLLAKPMLVTLPCLLLLLDVWPLGRVSALGGWRPAPLFKLIMEKLPLLALSIASGIITVIAQRAGGAVYSFDLLPISQRIANAAVAYVDYLWLMIWPVNLGILYPLERTIPAERVAVAALILIAVTALVGALRRRRPALLVGWLWYLGTLVPVIGLLQVGLQSMADRYTYVPLIGIFIMIAWSVPELSRMSAPIVTAVAAAALAVVITLAVRARVQVNYWRDSLTIFDRTLAVTQGNFVIRNVRGFALSLQQRHDEAIVEYRKALEIHKNYPAALNNLGNALLTKKDYAGAIECFRKSVRLIPESWVGHQNLGAAYVETGRFDEAMGHFREALRLRPQFAEAHLGLARSLAGLKRMPEAIPEYQAALEINPKLVDAHVGLGIALASQDRFDEAIAHFEEVLRLQPDNPDAAFLMNAARQQRDQSNLQ